jgi:dTMP kinase
MRGYLISFEGGDGSGKTTQAARLVESLGAEGIPVTSVREPGGTALGESVRQLLLDVEHHNMAAWAEANLYTAARAQLLKEVIIPRMAAGDVVVADRFADSTFAYQGAGRGLDMQVLMAMQMVLKVRPDLTILLDLEPAAGISRIGANGAAADRMEAEDIAFHTSVRRGYLDFAQRDPDRYHVIDAAQDVDAVAEAALAVALERVNSRGVGKAAAK